jgi:hypothetical protein
VIEGKNGFRIIAMTRLTFVPFGLQNALFSVCIWPVTMKLACKDSGGLDAPETYHGLTFASPPFLPLLRRRRRLPRDATFSPRFLASAQ